MSNIRPAQATLNELRDGQVMNELAAAIHAAISATREFRKAATVTLTITVKPMEKDPGRLIEDPIVMLGEVETKLPKAEPPVTLFFVNMEGQPTRSAPPAAQPQLPGLHVAGSNQP